MCLYEYVYVYVYVYVYGCRCVGLLDCVFLCVQSLVLACLFVYCLLREGAEHDMRSWDRYELV